MKITKMQATGNDFLLANNLASHLNQEEKFRLAKKLCQRRLSFGADGMIFLERNDQGLYMDFYNSDGSRGEMCGNGARCFSRYIYEELGGQSKIYFHSLAGSLEAKRIDRGCYSVRMPDISRYEELELEGRRVFYLEMGNPGLPHLLVELDDFDGDLRGLAKRLRHNQALEKGANVNFYLDRGGLVEALTYERGVEDFTLACGSGVTSIFYHLNCLDTSRRIIDFKVPGGSLQVEKDQDNKLFLQGPVIKVYECELIEE